jgi:hypothetical protein
MVSFVLSSCVQLTDMTPLGFMAAPFRFLFGPPAAIVEKHAPVFLASNIGTTPGKVNWPFAYTNCRALPID